LATAEPKRSKGTMGAFLVKRLLGMILVDGKFVSKKDLDRSLALQKDSNEQLGSTLVHMGILDPRDLDAALSVQRDLVSPEAAIKLAAGTRRLLGELLLEAKRISKKDLEHVLEEQGRTGEKLGELLKLRGLLSEKELKAVLAFQRRQGAKRPDDGKLRLGELLVATGQISRTELDDALKKQKGSKKRIGEILVEEGRVKPKQIDRALKLQQRLVTDPRKAYSTDAAKVIVTAHVMAHVKLKVLRQSSELIITNTDIARGYVDVPVASRIEIKNNNPAGYLLVFEGLDGPMRFIKGMYVKGGGREVYIESAELSYRFVLSRDARPGTYAWPLTISVRPA